MNAAVEIDGLRKTFRRLRGAPRVAVDGLDLQIPAGCVFGLLGPNGSGKTTTMRCLLGLVRADAGNLRALGAAIPRELPRVIGAIGAIVETPAFIPAMTGRRNLELLGHLARRGAREVDTVLESVGLDERAGDLVKGYSLGMRQRLGLAAALLKDPALLVLDEPANGLDPAGTRDIRALLSGCAAEGRTVLVSSHLLTEVGQTCDHVAIVHHGRCVVAGSVSEVLARQRGRRVRVRVADAPAGLRVLEQACLDVVLEGDELVIPVDGDDVRSACERVARLLGETGIWPQELRPDEATLEDLFFALTESDEEVAA